MYETIIYSDYLCKGNYSIPPDAILINNHFKQTMNIIHQLNEELLKQPFLAGPNPSDALNEGCRIALHYACLENAIAVLSDLKTNCSYIYYGSVSAALGLAEKGNMKVIHSIWEEDIFCRTHPDDLLEKHILELRFFYFLRNKPPEERNHYYSVNLMRMRGANDQYILIRHRMFYIHSDPNGNIRLALCLYSFPEDICRPKVTQGLIINSATGHAFQPDKPQSYQLLSKREKEIVGLIAQGKISKEIADELSISIHTVNRHRQNILEKLGVKNSIEACRLIK